MANSNSNAKGESNSLFNLKVVTFNCNGLADAIKRKVLLSRFQNGQYDVICLQETHILKDKIINEIIDKWEGVVHLCKGTGRGKGLISLFHHKYNNNTLTEVTKTERVLVSAINIESELILCDKCVCPF